MNFVGRFYGRRFMSLLVRQNFSIKCENVINKQINMELTASYNYLAMAFHFDRSDVALSGISNFFKNASNEERSHAELLMNYMNKRGGQIVLESISAPKCDYASALEAMRDTLKMEKTVNEALLEAHQIASQENDPNLCDFLEQHFLQEQVDALKRIADYIRNIERSDKEFGIYVFDQIMNKNELHKD